MKSINRTADWLSVMAIKLHKGKGYRTENGERTSERAPIDVACQKSSSNLARPLHRHMLTLVACNYSSSGIFSLSCIHLKQWHHIVNTFLCIMEINKFFNILYWNIYIIYSEYKNAVTQASYIICSQSAKIHISVSLYVNLHRKKLFRCIFMKKLYSIC